MGKMSTKAPTAGAFFIAKTMFFETRSDQDVLHIHTNPETNTSYDISVGEQLVLKLDENPTTGYRWHVEQHVPGLYFDEHDEFFPSSTGPKVVGTGGIRTLRFNARGVGGGLLVLSYRRSWNKDADRRLCLPVVIKSGRN